MTHYSAHLCAQEVSADAPEWVHLLPAVRAQGRDGRAWTVSNPQGIVDTFNARGTDLPIDYEHQSETQSEKRSGPVPAAGWIKELQARADGIWGRVDWTAKARELIAQKAYRYLSPVLMHRPGETEVRWLNGAGLVHHPNLTLTALASEDFTMDKNTPGTKPDDMTLTQRIIKMLGLSDTASDDEIAQALDKALDAMPDPEKYVPIEAMKSAMDDRNEQASAQAEANAQAKVQAALAEGHITPAMVNWATALCTQNPASFDAFIGQSPAKFGHLTKATNTSGLPPSNASALTVERKDDAAMICRQLGLEESALG
ncbi:hypothetical protein OS190_05985 [Sulfitobacter sp. F26204]|uniref:phage protease n=1 Tax=Sulfitobacter sp. F26204 TaxID=2996014 RepID=UPI00225DD81F|nr:phage protease [Sulfitobacter sp. F26204]MCX7559111.1 hypothetical protein [Sulfitobacter sp. F26204]